MKLTIEKHPELERLANCFQKIEDIAERMGIDLDEFLHPSGSKDPVMYTSFRKDLIHLSQKRVKALLESTPDSMKDENPSQLGMKLTHSRTD
jgi:hypothetical protein